MKFFTVSSVILIIVILTSLVESARIRRNEGNKKKSNLAVMLAYKPNSEIRTKDEHDNTWTYQIKDDDQTDSDELNKKLLDFLVKQKFGNYEEKTINKKRQANSLSCESGETIDDAKIVELKKHDKNSCYKNTYKNVLSAFEEALKSQIDSYKKCVCQKKQKTTTTTSSTTTTTTTLAPIDVRAVGDSKESEDGYLGNEEELATDIDNPKNVICFHKKHAMMLQKLLDTIPYKKHADTQITPHSIEEFQGNQSKRQERQNSRGKKSQSIDDNEEFKNQIMNILKEYLSVKKRENVKPTTTTTTTTTQPPPPPKNVDSDEDLTEEKFFEKLRNLFKQLDSDDDTFPMSENRRGNSESTVAVSTSKPIKKSSVKASINSYKNDDTNTRKSRRIELSSAEFRRAISRKGVAERSDESTETSIKLKKRKFEKKHLESEELSRNSINTKSYRTSTRSPVTTNSFTTSRAMLSSVNNSRYSDSEQDEEEETIKKISRESRGRDVDDDQLAGDLAKAISDLAKKYLKN